MASPLIDLSGLRAADMLDFFEVEIFADVLSLAAEARIRKPIPKESIPIKGINLGAGIVPSLEELLTYGTKLFDAMFYIILQKKTDKKRLEAFKLEILDPSAVPDKDYNPAIPSRQAVASLVLFHSRGSLPDNMSAVPMPLLTCRILGKTQKDYTEGLFVKDVCSFDLAHLNLQGIYNKSLDDWKLADEFKQRLAIAMAGHKGLKLCQLVRRSHPEVIKEPDNPTENKAYCLKLVAIMGDPTTAGCLYKQLHPSNKEIPDTYPEFYRTVIHSTYRVLMDYCKKTSDEALTFLRNLAMFNNEGFLSSKDKDKLAPILAFSSPVAEYDMSLLKKILKEPWYKPSNALSTESAKLEDVSSSEASSSKGKSKK